MTTKRQSVAELRAENRRLREISRDLQWMARRYADGRSSYAPSTVNDATRYLVSIGVDCLLDPIAGTRFARDGGGRKFDRLAPDEVGKDDPSERIPL